ncbi:MAG TPA: PAS domain S-box protein [Bacteroidales bacterium]|nr:PAS domain S-box protein [Bacteroidales bacterium]HPS17173.1 PAS domain S-box protein [Bacteroidales bacterium]
MAIKNIRYIILGFSILSCIIGYVFHFFDHKKTDINTDDTIFLISIISLALYGISYIGRLKQKPVIIAYAFEMVIAVWFISLTALNNFPEDFSYLLILFILMLGIIYTDTKGFLIFHLSILVVLIILAFLAVNPITHLVTFILLYVASGILMYFILKTKEKTQSKLEKAKANALSILQSSVGFFFFLDKDFKIISFNKFAKEIYSKEMHMELEEGKSILQYMPPDSHESLLKTLNECKNGKIIKNEKKANFPGGPSVWVENTFTPVYDNKNIFLGISFQTVNIDERKAIEEALIESEKKFLQMAENINDGLWIGTQSELIFINTAFEKIWGVKKEDVIKNPQLIQKAMHPEDFEVLSKKYPNRRNEFNPSDEQYRIIRADGEIRWVWARRFPVFDEVKNLYRTVGIVTDITDKKNTEAKILQQNEFLQTLINTIPNPVFYKDEKGRYLGCNKAFENNIGGKKENLIGKNVYDLSPKELADIYFEKDNELFKNPDLQIYESKVKYTDGSIHDVIFHKATFEKNDGSIGGLVGVILDITERKKFEDALYLSEKRFKEMSDTLPLLVYETDEKGNITYFNKAGFSYTGYTLEDFEKGLTLPMMFPPGEMERAMRNANRTMKGTIVGAKEYMLKRKDGSLYPAIINTVPIVKDNNVIGRRGVVTDITELKKVEEKVKASLKEKEILLKEIHHRVKNNMQIISSILRLQSSSIDNPVIHEVFLDAQQRINTMALVHEKLYQAKNFANIDVKEYINDLVSSISSLLNSNPNKIKVVMDVEPISINLDTMIPVGLILNELITNSMKYAFSDGRNGIISIKLKKEKDNRFRLTHSDNGIGFPENYDIENSQSLGLRLVYTLSEQLNGQVTFTNKNGSTFIIEFSELVRKI